MIINIGVDIVDLNRFRLFSSDQKFLDKCFSKNEMNLKMESRAGRFAAKEAFFKALDNKEIYRWSDIEVITQKDGSPNFNFRNQLADYTKDKKIYLSISHSGDSSIAFVVIEK